MMPVVDFSRFQLPARVLLSGSDCFHLVIDSHSKAHNIGGNVMRIAIFFDLPQPPQWLLDNIHQSPVIHWLCNIRLKNGFLFTIPYWHYRDQGRCIEMRQTTHPVERELPQALLDRDIPVCAERFVECDIVTYPHGTCALVFSWNHIVMDGRGMGLLLDHLQEEPATMPDIRNYFPQEEPRTSLPVYIRTLYTIKRFIQQATRKGFASVADDRRLVSHLSQFMTIRFNEAETAQIDQRAFEKGARFGANLFLLASSSHAFNAINQKRGNSGPLWVPVPYDGRLKGTTGPILTNEVAYVFYQLPESDLNSIETTVQSLNQQMMQQLKDGIPKQYKVFLNFMRHFPLRLYYLMIKLNSNKSFASFLYSSTNDNFNALEEQFKGTVSEINIYPPIVFPPGVTLSFLRQNHRLSITIGYAMDVVSQEEIALLETTLRHKLLHE